MREKFSRAFHLLDSGKVELVPRKEKRKGPARVVATLSTGLPKIEMLAPMRYAQFIARRILHGRPHLQMPPLPARRRLP